MDTFIIAMNSYFILPKAISALRDKMIGVVGTARFGINWPPKKLKVVQQVQATFNNFFFPTTTVAL